VIIVLTGLAIVYIARDRARLNGRRARRSLYGCVAVLAVAIVVNDVPYRIVYDSVRERVAFGDARCYVLAEAGPRLLLFCPDLGPPRNRIVSASDPAVRRTGIEENVFTLQR
jgi:hypothetical protein